MNFSISRYEDGHDLSDVKRKIELSLPASGKPTIEFSRMMDNESVSSVESSSTAGGSCSGSDCLVIRIRVPDLNIEKCLQFAKDEVIWEVKQQCLAALPKVCLIYNQFPCFAVKNQDTKYRNSRTIHIDRVSIYVACRDRFFAYPEFHRHIPRALFEEGKGFWLGLRHKSFLFQCRVLNVFAEELGDLLE